MSEDFSPETRFYESTFQIAFFTSGQFLVEAINVIEKKGRVSARDKAVLNTSLKIMRIPPVVYAVAPANLLHTIFEFELAKEQYRGQRRRRRAVDFSRSVISGAGYAFPEIIAATPLESRTNYGQDFINFAAAILEMGFDEYISRSLDNPMLLAEPREIIGGSTNMMPIQGYVGDPHLDLTLEIPARATRHDDSFSFLRFAIASVLPGDIIITDASSLDNHENWIISQLTHQNYIDQFPPESFTFSSIRQIEPLALLDEDDYTFANTPEGLVQILKQYLAFIALTIPEGTHHVSVGTGATPEGFLSRLLFMLALEDIIKEKKLQHILIDNHIPSKGMPRQNSPYRFMFHRLPENLREPFKPYLQAFSSHRTIVFQPRDIAQLTIEEIQKIVDRSYTSNLTRAHNAIRRSYAHR